MMVKMRLLLEEPKEVSDQKKVTTAKKQETTKVKQGATKNPKPAKKQKNKTLHSWRHKRLSIKTLKKVTKWFMLRIRRLATDVATKLQGKNKANYVPYLDNGDYVVVTNVSEVKVTGKKAEQKIYARHSGYPGGFKSENFNSLIKY